MCAGSVPRRRRGTEHFTRPVNGLLVCFRRLQTYAGAAVIVMTVQSSMGVAIWTSGPISRSGAPILVYCAVAV